MSAIFVDSHCHLAQYPDALAVLDRGQSAGVVTVVVTESPSDYRSVALRLGRREGVRVALGAHPLRASQLNALELAQFDRLVSRVDYVGEVGLDGSRDGRASIEAQRRVFDRVLANPETRCKVLSVHSRGAEAETIDRLAAAGCVAILHWYSGALKHLDAAVRAGLWFSVNPAMLRSRNGQSIIAALPPDRVVTESDGPHVRVGRSYAEPADMPKVIKGLSEIWGVSVEEASRSVFDTMGRIFAAANNRPVDQPGGAGSLR
ncbi:MAG: TatD family hydrolase [Dehalococcoidia bacterium]